MDPTFLETSSLQGLVSAIYRKHDVKGRYKKKKVAEQKVNPLLPVLKGREVIPLPTASGLTVTSSVEEGTVLCMH